VFEKATDRMIAESTPRMCNDLIEVIPAGQESSGRLRHRAQSQFRIFLYLPIGVW
jgi:hypothetical protein